MGYDLPPSHLFHCPSDLHTFFLHRLSFHAEPVSLQTWFIFPNRYHPRCAAVLRDILGCPGRFRRMSILSQRHARNTHRTRHLPYSADIRSCRRGTSTAVGRQERAPYPASRRVRALAAAGFLPAASGHGPRKHITQPDHLPQLQIDVSGLRCR